MDYSSISKISASISCKKGGTLFSCTSEGLFELSSSQDRAIPISFDHRREEGRLVAVSLLASDRPSRGSPTPDTTRRPMQGNTREDQPPPRRENQKRAAYFKGAAVIECDT